VADAARRREAAPVGRKRAAFFHPRSADRADRTWMPPSLAHRPLADRLCHRIGTRSRHARRTRTGCGVCSGCPGWHDRGVSSHFNVPTVGVDQVPDPVLEHVWLLDVREHDEWDSGHLHGAAHIPLGELAGRLDEVPAHDQVLVYCKSGGRSAYAAMMLQQAGVEAVNLDGGIVAWTHAGRPLA